MKHWYDSIGPSKITDQLYLSGYAFAASLWEKNPLGITHVLNVSTNEPYLETAGVTYCHVPFDDGAPIPPNKFAAALAFMRFAWENQGKILVHCAAGISRSATMVASFLHYSHQMDFNDAVTYIMSKRPVVNPAISVLNSARKQLKAWPYDGSMQPQSDTKKLIEEAVVNLIIVQAAKDHPNPNCPVRIMLQRENPGKIGGNVPRHKLECKCP